MSVIGVGVSGPSGEVLGRGSAPVWGCWAGVRASGDKDAVPCSGGTRFCLG